MNKEGLKKISYGLYIVNTLGSGCLINTLNQVTSDPAQVTITINNDNYTAQKIKESHKFNVTVLTENVNMDVIKEFGFKSSKDHDKYQDFKVYEDKNGIPYIKEGMAALIECEVEKEINLQTHTMFIAKVNNTTILSDDKVMTYDYYHQVKNGLTPPKSPLYNEIKKGWRCKICGYIYESDDLPEDFICPICGAPATMFEKIV